MPLHAALPWRELAFSLPIGIVAGFGSGALTWLVYACEDLFARVLLNPMWWPVLGGAVVGIGGLIQPHALGVGYDIIARQAHRPRAAASNAGAPGPRQSRFSLEGLASGLTAP